MLTKLENRFNIIFIKLIGACNLLPIQVRDTEEETISTPSPNITNCEPPNPEDSPTDNITTKKFRKVAQKSIQITLQTSKWRIWMWKLFFGTYILQGIYINARLAQSILFEKKWNINHLAVHLLWVLYAFVLQSWSYFSFVKWPQYSVGIFNELIRKLPVERVGQGRKWFQLNKQELMAKYIGLNTYSAIIPMMTLLAWDDTRIQLFYSALPPEWKSRTTFLVCLVPEGVCVIHFFTIAFFIFSLHLMFFEMVNGELKSVGAAVTSRSSKNEFTIRDALMTCKTVREMQLLIQLFNQSNCFIIFTYKIMGIVASIIGGFFAIRYTYSDPLLGVVCMVIALDSVSFFPLTYERAFLIPDHMRRLKDQLRIVTQKHTSQALRALEVAKIIHSVPKVGVKIGNFHTMKRETTPVFIHYIVYQLASLLVAF
ncbi:unnamed protein product [Allacma fusca]|uniref:Uncharacterized protein n=1 Tax=Allacma fusca TaxID=39272 RepID=A0A8J2PFR8_9HEXA|nr:unnamed protein product [Allacma fusca]